MGKDIETEREVTTGAVKAGDCGQLLPEFGRLGDVERLFGLTRGTTYNLLWRGEIKGCNLRVTGAKSGVRLIALQSVRDYIARRWRRAGDGHRAEIKP